MKGMLFTIGCPTPMTVTLPPLRAAKAAVQMLLSTPVHSRTLSIAFSYYELHVTNFTFETHNVRSFIFSTSIQLPNLLCVPLRV